MTQPSVRRNLFHQTLSRRPASTGPATMPPPPPPPATQSYSHSHSHFHPHLNPHPSSGHIPSMPPPSYPRGANMHSHDHSTGTGITTSRAAVHRLKHSSTETSRTIKMAPDNREIVVRDKNGGYKLEVPRLPPQALVSETGDGEELDDLDAGGSGNGEIAFGAELSGVDKEKFEAALVEMVIRHRNRQSTGEPDEIFNIVQESLRKKVAALDDDNWMFEPETDVRS
ncbi:hypothetical protein POX_c04484 [Penicillium oxalicum]|uniref:Uncharacterized protein n=1 Tax=Penicillium oxalicum (strain 114-2 / CGMCC 5302) TaxID=933388 RepID=S8AW45_PENO1|nr:hypothetical protein POX_c04484 [Penicillium oxalicum]EPS26102.1 hypothetical protein PDE_01038 [Penicillium oxalicum 114-2]KAI2791618.1 hypothetical protein POX_c04484 [Penicillium oxalicum]